MSVPRIERLQWADLRMVLPNEARDFTPWLADNLDLLAELLGLDDLALVGTESAVEDFRLDILATGTDATGDEIAVVIENQYGATDHDHLGKLVTYTAKAEQTGERVIGVWIVETPRSAHLAAVEFLNRVTNDTVGWFLVSARFVQGPAGFYVHFETHAEPNEFLRQPPNVAGGRVPPARLAFMEAVYDAVAEPLRQAGFRKVYLLPNRSRIRVDFPESVAVSKWAEIRLLAAKNRFRTVLFVRGGQAAAEHNYEVLEDIRQRHGDAVQAALADPEPIEWHARSDGDRSDYARYTWEHGYETADPQEAARRAIDFATVLLDRLRADAPDDYPDPDDLEDTSARADSETVMAIAQHGGAGEWTTYGDLSIVASGSSGAAIAIGNMARNNDAFLNPHRVLNAKGEIPARWVTGDGGGPEVARTRLEAEGLTFQPNGTANPENRIDVEELGRRWRTT